MSNTQNIRRTLADAFGGRLAPGASRPPSHAGTIRKSFTGEPTAMTEAEEAMHHINRELATCSTAELNAVGVTMDEFYGLQTGARPLEDISPAALKLVTNRLSERTAQQKEFKKAFGSPSRWL
jgi:hypothetical protein